jgi:hypothetical protein
LASSTDIEFGRDIERCASLRYDEDVSPTIFREGGYRFYFFSREELRTHVHVHHETGEARSGLSRRSPSLKTTD